MSQILTAAPASIASPQALDQASIPTPAPAILPNGMVERRRAGRIENASPELIALMRNPASRSARVRVALYDAPGFLLPETPRRPRVTGRSFAHVAIAMTACSVASAAAFKAMLLLWG